MFDAKGINEFVNWYRHFHISFLLNICQCFILVVVWKHTVHSDVSASIGLSPEALLTFSYHMGYKNLTD